MEIGFVIMQIGNEYLDNVYDLCISQAITDSGLKPVRIDKHNTGGLLKSEIVENIEKALIIVADLTNERPNCYLEVGYAMGLDKFNNLILTAREDHFHDSPNYKKGGPKIHFDLSGYDIYFWNPDNLDQFKKDLTQKIQRRLLRIKPKNENLSQAKEYWNIDWLSEKRNHIENEIAKLGIKGYMEVKVSVLSQNINISQSELLVKAKDSFLENFGWPIGVIIPNGEYSPIPKADGLVSEVYVKDNRTYDYSYYKKNGQFYTATSYFEDAKNRNCLIAPTRIIRVTEVFLFLARYYTNLGLSIDDKFRVSFKHTGLNERFLKESFHYNTPFNRTTTEDEIEIEFDFSIREVENNLLELVSKVIDPLLVLFDFYKVEKGTLSNYINDFINRKI